MFKTNILFNNKIKLIDTFKQMNYPVEFMQCLIIIKLTHHLN